MTTRSGSHWCAAKVKLRGGARLDKAGGWDSEGSRGRFKNSGVTVQVVYASGHKLIYMWSCNQRSKRDAKCREAKGSIRERRDSKQVLL
jgi:hypothetical protein